MAVNIDGDGLIALGGTSSTQGRLRLAEDTDNGTNYIELTAPASVGSDRTITFPDATTTVVGTDTTQTLTNKTIQGGTITSATAQASTSGTSIDFTGIPSWVKRVTVMFSGVSLSGTDDLLVQIADSGGIETSGYVARGGNATTAPAVAVTDSTSGYPIRIAAAGNAFTGSMVISNITGNTWVASYVGHTSATSLSLGSGVKTLSDTLTQISVTRTGTNTFDAGTINILFE